jgi:YARHG domain
MKYLLYTAVAVLALTSAASAQNATCDSLWYQRNQMFKRHGFCFGSPRAIHTFSNADCHVFDSSDVRFSSIETNRVNALLAQERLNNCDQWSHEDLTRDPTEQCIVNDPQPPLNVREVPNGKIINTLENGITIAVSDHVDDRNSTWAFVPTLNGWVSYHRLTNCYSIRTAATPLPQSPGYAAPPPAPPAQPAPAPIIIVTPAAPAPPTPTPAPPPPAPTTTAAPAEAPTPTPQQHLPTRPFPKVTLTSNTSHHNISEWIKDAQERGPPYAKESNIVWQIHQTTDVMTDLLSTTVDSKQLGGTNKSVMAIVEGTCINHGQARFAATIGDTNGKATIAIPDAMGRVRVNAFSVLNDVHFAIDAYPNRLIIAEMNSTDEALPTSTIWRWIAEVATANGAIVIQIPMFDPAVQEFLGDCQGK